MAAPQTLYCEPQDLVAVSAVAPDDVWAVGNCGGGEFGNDGLVEHWNGTRWSREIEDGLGGRTSNDLNAVSALSSRSAWMAGNYADWDGGPGHYIDHWDGSQWSDYRNNQDSERVWRSISALPGGPLFALSTAHAGQSSMVFQRFDGHRAHVFLSGMLSSISMSAVTNGWAVGGQTAQHFDGTTWTNVDIPGAEARQLDLVSVSTTSTDAWAVGTQTVNGHLRKVVEHYADGGWQVARTPSLHASRSSLISVSANGPDDVWTLARAGSGFFSMHWDGTSWTVVSMSVSGVSHPVLQAISSTPGAVWAVGSRKHLGGILRELWDGTEWVVR